MLEKKNLWHDDKPQEHVLIRWSDGTDSPTWEPLDLITSRLPNVLLEDKDVAIEGGVVTVPQPIVAPQREGQPVTSKTPVEVAVEAPRKMATEDRGKKKQDYISSTKAKRNVRPSSKLDSYVPK